MIFTCGVQAMWNTCRGRGGGLYTVTNYGGLLIDTKYLLRGHYRPTPRGPSVYILHTVKLKPLIANAACKQLTIHCLDCGSQK